MNIKISFCKKKLEFYVTFFCLFFSNPLFTVLFVANILHSSCSAVVISKSTNCQREEEEKEKPEKSMI